MQAAKIQTSRENESKIARCSAAILWQQREHCILKSSPLCNKAKALIAFLKVNPFQNPLSCEKLVGDLAGAYSRRITIQRRLVYQLYEAEKTLKIIRMWTDYA